MKTSRSRRTKGIPHVALILETSTAYGRAIIRGATRYIREAGPWTVYIEQRSLQDSAPPWLENWGGDGIISRASTPRSARAILRTGIPTVNLNDQVKGLGLPQIHSDHEAIARLAAEHLLDRGIPPLRLLRLPGLRMVGAPARGVRRVRPRRGRRVPRERMHSAGLLGPPAILLGREKSTARRDGSRSCPSPWASWPATTRAASSSSTPAAGPAWPCRRRWPSSASTTTSWSASWPIPRSPASSPTRPASATRRAALLDRLMKGEPAPAAMQTVPPQGLAIRQSSDVTAIADPRLADAMRFIREHACDGIGVDDVLDHLAVSRSVLQRLFRKQFDRTILDTITGVRIARVKQLLTETDLPLAVIAQRAGFTYMEYLSTIPSGARPAGRPARSDASSPDRRASDTAPAPVCSSTRSRRIESVRSNGHPSRRTRHDHDPENRPVLHAGRPARRRGRRGGRRSTDLDPPLQQDGRPAPARHVDPADGLPGPRRRQGRPE